MQKYLAEFIGTLFFCFVIIASPNTSMKPLTIGAALTIAIMVLGKLSGGHFNPAVTIMMMMMKKMKQDDVIPYIVAQVLGGVVAIELTKVL
tara:strand:- start:181 stop:453 length:273 start_codon:yes stop_codon:yes gene_type:complete